MNKYFLISNSRVNLALSILFIAAINLACMEYKKPWRDYSAKPFSSQEWLAGDRIERGRMTLDLFKKRIPNGKTREQIVEILGEPDKKKTVEKREVWFYKTDIGISGAFDNFPVSFDDKERASAGVVTGGTISIGAKDDDF
ncbi:MAG: hypothetical protein WKF92_12265 [Pyrinomonadaceae bacterium]